MRVSLGSPGRFHTFDLARELARRNMLWRLYTAYPRYKVDAIEPQRVATYPWFMLAMLAARRLRLDPITDQLNRLVLQSYDKWMAKRLERCDIFHCLSGFGVESHQVARSRYGAITICDRGSTHILKQNEILREEYQRWKIPYKGIDPIVIERELAEYELCDRIVVPSDFVLRSFIEKGVPREKIAKIPYGVDLSLFRKYPKEDRIFRVLYVGALSLRKGLPYLLEAVSGVQLPYFELWLIGDRLPEVDHLLRKYSDCFRYIGIVPRWRLAWFYSQASVFVLPSVEEGLALVQAQAMACGLPVIATPNTGAEDLFRSGREGFIVPPRDPSAIREKIIELYESPAKVAEMSEYALQRVRQLGGWQRYGDKMVEIYRDSLAKVAGKG